MSYYGIYKADEGYAFATEPQEELVFPPGIEYKEKSYRLMNTMQCTTPSQHEAFEVYCKEQSITMNISW